MRRKNCGIQILIGSIIAAAPLFGEEILQVREGQPIAEGVYVNGHGPYRFLVDTGASINLIEANLAKKIGLTEAFRSSLASSIGSVTVPGSDEIEVRLGSVKATGQKFLFSPLESVRKRWPDVQGILGQSFLARFDYLLDLRAKTLAFGTEVPRGTRAKLKMVSGRPAVSTSLGDLVLDSGAVRLTLFGVKPDMNSTFRNELRTVTGSQPVASVYGQALVIEGRKIWKGEALAIPIPTRAESAVDGLLPLCLFKRIYFCNSEGYVVFE